jgi:hypothetical protein
MGLPGVATRQACLEELSPAPLAGLFLWPGACNQACAAPLMQRACRVPLGSGWSADDPDPGARAGKPTHPPPCKGPGEVEPSGAAICATNSAARRCGGGPAAVPATPFRQARLMTRAPSLRRGFCLGLGACATNRPAAPLIWCVRIGGARRAPLGHSRKLPRSPPHEFFFVQTAFNIAMLPSPEGGKHTWRKHDDQVNCCRRLSRGRRNFGARDNSGADSSAGRHALASSLGVRPV